MVAHNFKIPPKAPNIKSCGNCEGCKRIRRKEGYQHCKYHSINNIDGQDVVKAFSHKTLVNDKPIPPEARLIDGGSNVLLSAAFLALAGIAMVLLGFIAAIEVNK